MNLSDKKWIKYVKENYYKFIVWFVFIFVTTLLGFLTFKIIERIVEDPNSASTMKPEEVKIYFQKTTPDSLLIVLKEEVDNVQKALESIQQDSITVSVQKVTK